MGKVSKALEKAGENVETRKHEASVFSENIKVSAEPETPPDKSFSRAKPVFTKTDPPPQWDERLVEAAMNYPAVAENFRRLRTKILHPTEGQPVKSLIITSVGSQEGKSFVCANLGIIMAQSVSQHALMVDCDLRRPALGNFFGLKANRGLADHLQAGTDLADLIVPTGLERLSLIPAGSPPDNPSELLSSQRMSTMIVEIVNRYDDRLILLDSPPALAASETAVLAQHVDKVLIVVRWGGAGRDQLKKLIEQIGRERVLGLVFNAFEMNFFDKRLQGEGYYNYYSDTY